jgi:hypothetical protein
MNKLLMAMVVEDVGTICQMALLVQDMGRLKRKYYDFRKVAN